MFQRLLNSNSNINWCVSPIVIPKLRSLAFSKPGTTAFSAFVSWLWWARTIYQKLYFENVEEEKSPMRTNLNLQLSHNPSQFSPAKHTSTALSPPSPPWPQQTGWGSVAMISFADILCSRHVCGGHIRILTFQGNICKEPMQNVVQFDILPKQN